MQVKPTVFSLDTRNISKVASTTVTEFDVDKVQAEAQEPKQLTSEDFFNKQEGDLDLTTEIYKAIQIIISKEAADYFINDPIIVTTKGTASIYQRVLINRFFIQLLTRARAYMDLEGLTMVFTVLTNEGTHVPWMQDLNRVLFPYLKTNNVFGFFLDVQKEINNNLSKSE